MGAQHVICVKRSEKIEDGACKTFTESFYHACFEGKLTICEAFSKAQNLVNSTGKFRHNEGYKFKLLKQGAELGEHKCCQLISTPKGEFRDLTPKGMFQMVPPRVEGYVGRHVIMYELIKLIRLHRFVTVKGVCGIGKGTLAREAVRFMFDRQFFKDGVTVTVFD